MTNFVLIHGSYQGGWVWQQVTALLRAQGHQVHAPTSNGCAERAGNLHAGITTETLAAEIAQLLYFEDLSDTVLVATSSGGMVMTKAAESARDRVSRLVYADALALRNGEKIGNFVDRPAEVSTDLALGPSRESVENRLFAGLEPDLRAWAVARYTLHPAAVHTQPVQLGDFWSQSWDASVIWCRQAPNPGEAHQRRCAEALGARWHELDTGHYPMLSMPEELAELIQSG